MERPNWAPVDIDLERPSIARVYDYWLGGAHNFAADRAVAAQALQIMPELRGAILANRLFLRRAVRYLASVGVRQFLDLGSGIPTVGNVHEIAQQSIADAKVVYVDIDPVAVAHSRALLADDPTVAVLHTDIRDPLAVLDATATRALLDFDQPIGVLMIALMHFVPDSDDPAGIIAEYRDGIAPGSHFVMSHLGTDPGEEPEGWSRYQDLYARSVTPLNSRTSKEFEAFFDGFELVEPGVTRIPLWHPESADDVDENSARFPGFAAVGRKP